MSTVRGQLELCIYLYYIIYVSFKYRCCISRYFIDKYFNRFIFKFLNGNISVDSRLNKMCRSLLSEPADGDIYDEITTNSRSFLIQSKKV